MKALRILGPSFEQALMDRGSWARQTKRYGLLLALVALLSGCAQAPFLNGEDESASSAASVPASDFGADLLPRRGEILPSSSVPVAALESATDAPRTAKATAVSSRSGNGAKMGTKTKNNGNGARSGEILPASAFVPIEPSPAESLVSTVAATDMEVSLEPAPVAVNTAAVSANSNVPLAPPAPLPDLPPEVAARAGSAASTPGMVAMAAQTRLPDSGGETLLKLGPGDAVVLTVFGRPEFNTTTYVSDKGEIAVPLAGNVQVAGLSPAEAGRRVGEALKRGQFLVNPQVSITLSNFRSQQVSVLGEVKAPGRFPIETKTTVFDLLAQAGGVLETGSDTVYLLRPNPEGQVERYPFDLKGLTAGNDASIRQVNLRGGDSIYVPRAEHFYVYGEVAQPNRYRLEPGTTVVQAISRSGGLTPRGSERRIEIKRRDADGKYQTIDADLTDPVLPDDVIRVKERIF